MALLEDLDQYFGSYKAAGAGQHHVLDEVMRADPYFSPPHDLQEDADGLTGYTSGRLDGLDAFIFDHPHQQPAAPLQPSPQEPAPQQHQYQPQPQQQPQQQQHTRQPSTGYEPPPLVGAPATTTTSIPVSAILPMDPGLFQYTQVPAVPDARARATSSRRSSHAHVPTSPNGAGIPSPPSDGAVSPPLEAKLTADLMAGPPALLHLAPPANAYYINTAHGPGGPMAIGWPQAMMATPMFATGPMMMARPGSGPEHASAAAAAAAAAAAWYSGQPKVPIHRLPHPMPSTSHATAAAAAVPVVVKEVKKSAHNVIERRYRNNINERIAELRSVCPPTFPGEPAPSPATAAATGDDKMNKGKILRRATDYIRLLSKANEAAQRENEELRDLVRRLGGADHLDAIAARAAAAAAAAYGALPDGAPGIGAAPTVPSSGTSGDDDADAGSDDGSSDLDDGRPALESTARAARGTGRAAGPAPKRQRTSAPTSARALSEGSRVLLVACLGLCVLAGPLTVDPVRLAGTAHVSAVAASAGRALQGVHDEAPDGTAWAARLVDGAALLWMAVRILGGLVSAFLLFRGEPILGADSPEFAKARASLAQAEEANAAGDCTAALAAVEKGLEIVGRPPPVTTVEVTAALVLQTLRQLSHVVRVGQGLERALARRSLDARASFALGADLLDLHQRLRAVSLDPVRGSPSLRRAQAVHGALTAVNVAEAVGLAPADAAHTYVVAAMQLHAALPTVLSFVPSYFLQCARRQLSIAARPPASPRTPPPPGPSPAVAGDLGWLRTPEGYDFFEAGTWVAPLRTPGLLTHASHAAADPVARFAALFREHQLAHAFASVLEHELPAPLLLRLEHLVREAQAAHDVTAEWWAVAAEALVLEQLQQTADAAARWARLAALAQLHPAHTDSAFCHSLLLAVTARDAALAGHLELAMRAADRAARFVESAPSGSGLGRRPSETRLAHPTATDLAPAPALDHAPPTEPAPHAGRETGETEADVADAPAAPEPESAFPSVRIVTLAVAAQLVVEARLAAAARLQAAGSDAHIAKVLASARADLVTMRRLAAASRLAQQQAAYYRLRASFRGLAGGSAARTSLLVDKALHVAHTNGLRYEEGATHHAMAWLLTRSPTEVQKQLLSALYCYEQVDATRDVHALKRLLLHS